MATFTFTPPTTRRAKRRLAVFVGSMIATTVMATAPAHAASYNIIVPGLNGTGYSGAVTKVVEDLDGEIWSGQIGSNYQWMLA